MRGKQPNGDYQALERALSDALNGNPAPTKRTNRARPTFKTHHITLIYSVRHSWGGRRFRVSFDYDTFNLFEAQTKAERAIRENRYIDVVLVDAIRDEISSKQPH